MAQEAVGSPRSFLAGVADIKEQGFMPVYKRQKSLINFLKRVASVQTIN